MMFFADPAISLSDKLLECVYILIGLITIYAGLKNLFDRENPSRFGTFVFWTSFGVVCTNSLEFMYPVRISFASQFRKYLAGKKPTREPPQPTK